MKSVLQASASLKCARLHEQNDSINGNIINFIFPFQNKKLFFSLSQNANERASEGSERVAFKHFTMKKTMGVEKRLSFLPRSSKCLFFCWAFNSALLKCFVVWAEAWTERKTFPSSSFLHAKRTSEWGIFYRISKGERREKIEKYLWC